MSESRLRRLEELFHAALDLPPERRGAWLEGACAEDPGLRAEVEDLLARHGDDRDPLPIPVASPAGHNMSVNDATPDEIGPYRLRERVGTGAFGEVYAAEQFHPVRRRVALKLLRAGLDSRRVLARFEAERHALARMDHPGVARVLDAGATPAGRPWFAMELVEGVPVTEYCDREGVRLRDRLELMIAICRAVEHAHQKGILHRDLKPSNVLVATVDGRPVPKVIDFGIAKALAEPLAGEDSATVAGEFLGTPEYMSPEQALSGGTDVDTRSDVYSLGVLLYRLLTGHLPFSGERLRRAGIAEIQRILRDEEPPRPSRRVAEPPDPASPPPPGLPSPRELRGDLDWIVLRAMEKDPARRYGSPAALAEDLLRHLRHEPVAAGPPGATYRIRKFARRHRTGVLAAAGIAVVLAGGIVATWVQGLRARAAEREATRQAAVATSVNDFLTRMLAAANPEVNPRGLDFTVREMLDLAAAGLEADSTGPSSATSAGIRQTVGVTYMGLGLYEEAEPHLAGAAAVWREIAGPGARETFSAELALARVEALRGRYDAAETRLADMEARAATAGPDLEAGYYQTRGGALSNLSRFDEADSLLALAVRLRRAQGADDPAPLVEALNEHASIRASLGRFVEAEAFSREAYTLTRAARGRDHHETALSAGYLASMLRRLGNYAAAESLFRESIDIDRRILGPDHPFLGQSRSNFGISLEEAGRPVEAEVEHREALRILRASLGPKHPIALSAMGNLATSVQSQGRLEEALVLRREVLALISEVLGPGSEAEAIAINNLGSVYRLLGRYDEGAATFRRARAAFAAVYGEKNPNTVIAIANLGRTLLDAGRFAEAEAALREARAAAVGVFPEGHVNPAVMAANHGKALFGLGRLDEAEAALLPAHATILAKLGSGHARTREAAGTLAALYRAKRNAAEAARWSAAAEGGGS